MQELADALPLGRVPVCKKNSTAFVSPAPALKTIVKEKKISIQRFKSPSGLECFFDAQSTDKVLIGGAVVRKAYIRNTGSDKITITALQISGKDSSSFMLSSLSFPIVIDQGKELCIDITLKGLIEKAFMGTSVATLNISATTTTVEFPLSARSVIPMPNGTTIPIEDTSNAITFSSTEYSCGREFNFKNTTSRPIEITDAFMASGGHGITFVSFKDRDQMPPILLAPSEEAMVRLRYSVGDGSLHSDKFILVCSDHVYTYPVQVLRRTPSNLANGMGNRQLPLSVTTNSSSGTIAVKILGGFKGDISIYNSAGALLAAQKNTTAWIWKATSNGKPRTTDEEFVVNVKAVDSDGSVLTRSEKSVLIAAK